METLDRRLQKRINASLYALLFLTGLLGLSVLLEGCTERCETTYRYVYMEPVFTPMAEIRASVRTTEAQPVEAVGKIYFKDDFLYLNDPGRGIHIIDNHDPAQPKPLKFIEIPGSYELAIRGNTLYADSYIDLVVFDITDIGNIREVGRLPNVFTHQVAMGHFANEESGVLTSFEQKAEVEIVESDCKNALESWGGRFYRDGIAVYAESAVNFSTTAAIAPGQGSGSGAGGSMARFTVNGAHLYLLDGADLQTIDISSAHHPVAKSRTSVAWDIETIFPYESNLFIGSASGMHIFDVSNPEAPAKVSTYAHVRSCDPVVVEGNYAYVTLRSGTACQGFTNQLEVIDISDLSTPRLLATYQMTNPHGLGIDNGTLFICDGRDGLKAFDARDVHTIGKKLLAHYKGIDAYDVIPFDDVLMMIGQDGLFQYDYSEPKNMKLLSSIRLQP